MCGNYCHNSVIVTIIIVHDGVIDIGIGEWKRILSRMLGGSNYFDVIIQKSQ
jgi:hypothetical protein